MWHRRAHLLRVVILATAIGEVVRGDVLYGLFCLVALGLTLVPAIIAHRAHRGPVRTLATLEVAVLVLMVADMTLGNLLGLYVRLPWYDKVLHVAGAILVGWIGVLSIRVLHATGRVRLPSWLAAVAILLVTLGVGALWEIAEYAVDRVLGRAAQSAPGVAPLDDTMIDLAANAAGGVVAAVIGSLCLRGSARNRRRVGELGERAAHRLAPPVSPRRGLPGAGRRVAGAGCGSLGSRPTGAPTARAACVLSRICACRAR